MRKIVLCLAGALLVTIIVGYNAKSSKEGKDVGHSDSIEKIEKKPIVMLQPNDTGIVYSDTLLNHCVSGLQTLNTDGITDSTTLFAEVRKAIELERGFLKCFNKLHTDTALSNVEKADSMVKEAYADIDSLCETGVTTDMVVCTFKHFSLGRYRELLCYKDLVSSGNSMSASQKKALLEEALAWHRFYDTVTEFAVQCVQLDFFTGGSMLCVAAPYCVLAAQECRTNTLKILLYVGAPQKNGVTKDYEKWFIDKMTSRMNSLDATSRFEYIKDKDVQQRYLEECYIARETMIPKVISTLKERERKRKALVCSIYSSGSDVMYDYDVSAVLTTLSEIIEPTY